jgi:orotate phosphoribosyltransferase
LDLIVGVPRSGLLAGSLLALHLNLPLTDVDGLISGTLLQTGRRYDQDRSFSDLENILIIDDSVNTGETMDEVKARIESNNISKNIQYGAVYVSHLGSDSVDTFAQLVPTPRVFEWNIMHHDHLPEWMVDLDGVLCRDPTPTENDDGKKYRAFLQNVEPKVIPSVEIGNIVTCRLEKYRDLTEQWLDMHGIEYKNLIMMDYPDMETRQANGNHGEYKANIYSQSDASLFIESSEPQAEKIAHLTSKPVFCMDENYMLRQGYLKRVNRQGRNSVKQVQSNPIRYIKEFYSDPKGFTEKALRHIVFT